MFQTFKQNFHLVISSFKNAYQDWLELQKYNNLELRDDISRRNLSRIIPFGVLLFVTQITNFLAVWLINRQSTYQFIYTGVFLFLCICSILFIYLACKGIVSKKTTTSYNTIVFRCFICCSLAGLTILSCLDIAEHQSINNAILLYTFLCLVPILSLKGVSFLTIISAIFQLIVALVFHLPILIIQQLFMVWITSIVISQLMLTNFKRNFFNHQQLHDLNQRLLLKTETDALTGLQNRYGFTRKIEIIWPYCIQSQQHLAFLMIDVDHFKAYNDTFGHQTGDICLKKIARTISDSVKKETDIITRFGGEEFLIVLNNITESRAIEISKRILRNVENKKIEAANTDSSDFVTVSVGLSIIKPTHSNNYQTAIEESDSQLYFIKEHGRNAVSFKEKIYKSQTK